VPTAARVAKNESLFREVNERIRDLSDRFADGADVRQRFVCECSRTGCSDPIELDLKEYEAVRRSDKRFAVAPGHTEPEHEHVVLETDRYWVIEKDGAAGEIADEEADATP
jgi:hypothetical protein